MANFPVRPQSVADLKRGVTPQSVPGGQSEAVPWNLFFVRTYDSGVTQQLIFFDSAPTNPRRGNVGPTLPDPQYFTAFYAYLTVLSIPATTSAITDTWQLLFGTGAADTGLPTWKLEVADKKLGPFPLHGLHAFGGATGGRNDAAAVVLEWANNADPTGQGTFCFDGSVTIPPQQAFSVTIDWPAPVTLAGGDTQLCVTLAGVLHRRVL